MKEEREAAMNEYRAALTVGRRTAGGEGGRRARTATGVRASGEAAVELSAAVIELSAIGLQCCCGHRAR